MAAIVNTFNAICLLAAAALILFGLIKAEQAMKEEAARAELRRQTANAMRTDKHLARLKRQKMRVQYMRRARVW